jgi:putative SOS response-associated peptidase YedK
MFHAVSTSPTPFDTDNSLETKRAIIRRNPEDAEEVEMIEAIWGSNLRFTDGVDYRFVRADEKPFHSNRCLIPASEFQMKVGDKRFRATLDCGNWFYLAGVWDVGAEDQVYFRIITVYAGSDMVDYQQRHGAIILRRQRYDWLDSLVPAGELLRTPSAHTLHVERIGGPKLRRQVQLAL